MIDKARVEAQSRKLTVEDPASIEYMTKYIAGVQQRYTQSGGVRPFGVSTLVVGFDPNDPEPKLYMTEPSGIYSAWKANAIGRNSKTVRELLEKSYEENMSKDATIRLTVKSLLEIVQTGAKNIEIMVLEPGKEAVTLDTDSLNTFVTEIEAEKEAEAAAKKQTRSRRED